MKDGEKGQPIENNGMIEQKEWLDNTLPDPHLCTAGNKEEEHNYQYCHIPNFSHKNIILLYASLK